VNRQHSNTQPCAFNASQSNEVKGTKFLQLRFLEYKYNACNAINFKWSGQGWSQVLCVSFLSVFWHCWLSHIWTVKNPKIPKTRGRKNQGEPGHSADKMVSVVCNARYRPIVGRELTFLDIRRRRYTMHLERSVTNGPRHLKNSHQTTVPGQTNTQTDTATHDIGPFSLKSLRQPMNHCPDYFFWATWFLFSLFFYFCAIH